MQSFVKIQAEENKQELITVCDVIANPQKFDGKRVRLRAIVISGFEIFAIRDPRNDCSDIWLAYAGGGPTASTSMNAQPRPINRSSVLLRRDGYFKKFEKYLDAEMYPRDRGVTCLSCKRYEVTATMTGHIDVAPEKSGFGHLNARRFQFVLESVSDIEAKDYADNYDSKLFSAQPVRYSTAYLVGRVLSPNGQPIGGIRVTAVSTEDVPLYLERFSERADEKGRFKLGVPPGKYIVGINVKTSASRSFPFNSTYYAGTTDINAATKIIIADRQRVNLEIKAQSSLVERGIPVKVIWTDGKAAQDANVWISEEANPHSVVGNSVSHTDSDGYFNLVGFQGISYVLRASIYLKPAYTPYCAEKQIIKASDIVSQPIELVLKNTGDGCRANYE